MTNKRIPEWLKLDNAAKIFPPTSTKRDSKVIRFSCELKEEIDPKLLQKALDKNMLTFPFYRSVLKRGLFWYYLDYSHLLPTVHQEKEPICSPLYNKNKKTLLFRVTYFKKRINLEVYHVLSDGTGALQFLKGLIYQYLLLKYPSLQEENINMDYDASQYEKMDDSFQKYYDNKGKRKHTKIPKGFIITGKKHKEYQLQVIEGTVQTSAIISLAHQYHTTATVLLTAIFIKAIELEMTIREKRKPIIIAIPVNLRNYFSSQSARNFFGVFNVIYFPNIKQENSLEDIIPMIDQYFKTELKKEEMAAIINSYTSLEDNPLLRIVPLFLKNFILKIASKISERNTSTLSNVGKINLPQELQEYVNQFNVFMSTNKIQVCVCSYLDKMTLSFTSPFLNTNIEKNFFRILSSFQMEAEITTNIWDKEE